MTKSAIPAACRRFSIVSHGVRRSLMLITAKSCIKGAPSTAAPRMPAVIPGTTQSGWKGILFLSRRSILPFHRLRRLRYRSLQRPDLFLLLQMPFCSVPVLSASECSKISYQETALSQDQYKHCNHQNRARLQYFLCTHCHLLFCSRSESYYIYCTHLLCPSASCLISVL